MRVWLIKSVANISFCVTLLLFAGIASLSYRNNRSLIQSAESQYIAFDRLDQLQEFLMASVDIETGYRGYIITSDPKFLEPYNSGVARMAPQLERLRATQTDDPLLRENLLILADLAGQLRQYGNATISLEPDDGKARDLIAGGGGKLLMDRIRQHVGTLTASERTHLMQREQHNQTSMRQNQIVIVVGSLTGFAVMGFAAVTTHLSLKERTRLNRELQKSLIENASVINQLRIASVDLIRSNAELEQFAYIASHDLQEPLRKVSGFAQLLATQYRGKLDRDADEFIGFMVDGALRMQTLIQNLLIYARLGRKGEAFSRLDCNVKLQHALSNLRAAIEESGAVITSEPLPMLWGDKIQMVQLFQNLIGNAIKFHGTDPPRIEIRVKPSGREWLFSVSDNGIGIDPQFKERIFVIFQRLHGRDEYPGTGIGLSFCQKIVERHGGSIWLESRPGPGSTFCFTFPRSAEATYQIHEQSNGHQIDRDLVS